MASITGDVGGPWHGHGLDDMDMALQQTPHQNGNETSDTATDAVGDEKAERQCKCRGPRLASQKIKTATKELTAGNVLDEDEAKMAQGGTAAR